MNRQRDSIMEDEYAWTRRQPNYQMYADIGKSLAAHEETGPGKSPGNIVRYYRKREEPMYMMMTEEEVELYDYYLGRDRCMGGNEAKKYLKQLNETLRQRQGEAEAQKLAEMKDGFGQTAAYGVHGFKAGVDNKLQGAVGSFSDTTMPRSAMQFEKQKVSENADWGDKLAYDLSYRGGEYAMGLMADGLTAGYGGTVLDFLAERGNARQDALREGKEKKIARSIGNYEGSKNVLIPEVVKRFMRK